MYDPKITAKKGGIGALDGAIVGLVATSVIGLMKTYIKDLSPDQENMIAGSVGIIVSAVVLAVKSYVSNMLKHRQDKEPVQDQDKSTG